MSNRSVVAAALVILAAALAVVLATLDRVDDVPTPTTYLVNPDGDNVVITPRAAP